MTTENRTIRVPCTVDGHESDWIEFDTSAWGIADYRQMYYADSVNSFRTWVERDSTNWYITGDNGSVLHPGQGAERSAWLTAYKAIGPTAGIALYRWLYTSPILAFNDLLNVSKKSTPSRETSGAGDGEGDTTGG